MHSSQPPHLSPGLRVVRRGLHHLQVGLYAGHRVLLPRTSTVERTLDLLLDRRPPDGDPASTAVLDELDRHGCLVRVPPRLRARRSVAVLGGFDDLGPPATDALLSASGLERSGCTADGDPVVVLSTGELDRDRLDPLIRSRTGHVIARLVDGAAVLGPFVVPGTTACLRCIDAHQSVVDPDHVAVTARYVRATARPRPDGVPDVEASLATLALAWVVRDVVAYLEGRTPSTWSRTLTLFADPATNDEQTWLRHPRCGCCWSADARLSGTMEA